MGVFLMTVCNKNHVCLYCGLWGVIVILVYSYDVGNNHSYNFSLL